MDTPVALDSMTAAYPSLSGALVENSFDGIIVYDTECRYRLWNREMERISGMDSRDVLGRCAFTVFPFLKQVGADQCILRAMQGETVMTEGRPFVIPETGRRGFFNGHYSPLRDNDGKIIGALTIVRDVTERKVIDDFLNRQAHPEAQVILEPPTDVDVALMAAVCKAIQQRRKMLGLTQEQLAEHAGLHRTYISDIERGTRNPSIDCVLKLCKALELEPSALFLYAELQCGQARA